MNKIVSKKKKLGNAAEFIIAVYGVGYVCIRQAEAETKGKEFICQEPAGICMMWLDGRKKCPHLKTYEEVLQAGIN